MFHSSENHIFSSHNSNSLMYGSQQLYNIVFNYAVDLHKSLGRKLADVIYENALIFELESNGYHIERPESITMDPWAHFDNLKSESCILVENSLLVAVRSVEHTSELNTRQIAGYLKMFNFKEALLINFNVDYLKRGIKLILV